MKVYKLYVKFATGWQVHRVTSDIEEIITLVKVSLDNNFETKIEIL